MVKMAGHNKTPGKHQPTSQTPIFGGHSDTPYPEIRGDTSGRPNLNVLGRETSSDKIYHHPPQLQHKHQHQNRSQCRLSPVFDPKASSNKPRLYNTNRHSDTTSLVKERTHFKDPCINDKALSTAFNSAMNMNSSGTKSPSKDPLSCKSPTFRDIFSPIPNPESLDRTVSPGAPYVPTPLSNPKQKERRSSDIVFPSIKVDSYCDDQATPPTPHIRSFIHDRRTHSTGNLLLNDSTINQLGFDYRENNNNNSNNNNNNNNNNTKCLMVPPTLVRTRSTDGRLIIATKDRSMFPTISKAWSKSEGNFFSGRPAPTSINPPSITASPQRVRLPESTRSQSQQIKPENAEFQFEEIIDTKPYKKLGPIPIKTDKLSCESTSSGIKSGGLIHTNPHPPDNTYHQHHPSGATGLSVSDNDVSMFPKTKPNQLDFLGCPQDGSFSPKQHRSKSYSPQRRSHSHLNAKDESDLVGGEGQNSNTILTGFLRDGHDDGRKQDRPNISFLSPQPLRKLGPIKREKSDI